MANLPPPVLSRVSFDNQQNLIQVEINSSDIQNWIIKLCDGNGSQLEISPVQQDSLGIWQPSEKLNVQTVYKLKVAQCDQSGSNPGPYGPEADVIVAPLENVIVTNHEKTFDVTWTLPGLGNVKGGLVRVVNTSNHYAVIEEELEGCGGTIQWLDRIKPTNAYNVIVSGLSGITTGPNSGPVSMLFDKPIIVNVFYSLSETDNSARLRAECSPPLPQELALKMNVYCSPDDRLAASSTQPSTSVTLDLAEKLDPSYIYYCRTCFKSSNACGPESDAIQVITVPQVIKHVEFDGQKAVIEWQNLQIRPIPVAGSLSILQDTTPAGSGIEVGEKGEITPTTTIDPTLPYHIKLNPVLGKSVGPKANSIPLIVVRQNLISALYNGQRITVTWSGAKSDIVTGYLLHLLDNGTVVKSIPCGSSASGEQRGFMDVELDPKGSYQVALQAVGNCSSGPAGTTMKVIAYVPGIQTIVTGSNSVVVTLNEPATPHYAVKGYHVVLFQGDVPVLTQAASKDSSPVATITYTFQPQFSYTVRAQAIGTDANILSGPLSPAKDIISTAPVIQSIDYDGTDATITWKSLEDEAVNGYAVVLTEVNEGAGDPVYTDDNIVVVPANKTKNYTVTIQATGGVCQGPASDPKPILKETKEITGAFYDGQRLTVTWSGAKVKNVTGYLLHLLDNGTIVESIPCGSSESGEQRGFMDVELDPLGSYQVKLQAVGKGLKAPPGTAIKVIAYVPGIQTIVTSSNSVVVTLNESATPPYAVSGYQVVLYHGDIPVSIQEASADSPPVATITHTFLPQFRYTVRAMATSTHVAALSGPFSPAKDIISTAPVIQSIDYDGTNATITWKPLEDEAVTGYAIVLTEAAEGAGDPWYTDDNTVVVPADITKSYTVTVQATGDVCQGPMSNPKPILKETKEITGAFYDGQRLMVTWSGAKVKNVTGYLLHLLDNGTVVESIPCGSSASGEQRGFMNVELDPLGSYQVKLQAVGEGLKAPPGTAIKVIAYVPEIQTIVTNSNRVVVTLNEPANSPYAVSGYQVVLFQGDVPVLTQAASKDSSPVATITDTLQPQFSYTVRAQAIGTDANILPGPLSPAKDIISTAPVIQSIDYDGTNVTITWKPLEDEAVTGYAVVLTEAAEGAGDPVYTDDNTVVVPADKTKSYTVAVQATGDISRGPFSIHKPILKETRKITGAFYDGQRLMVTWSGAKVKNVTGYLLHLLDNGTVVESIPCGSSESGDQRGFMDVELDPLGSYQVKLQAVGKGLKAPPGTAMKVIAYVPGIKTIVTGSNSVVVTLNEPANSPYAVSGYQVVLFQGDVPVLTQAASKDSSPVATITHTFLPQFSYTVRAQAIGTDANILSGPLSPAKDIISTAPVIQSIDYDGTDATITWKPLEDEAVTGYAVVLTEAAEGAGDPVYTDDNTVVVPADKTKSYTVAVQATGDISRGPFSIHKPILKETKKITGAFYDGQRLTVTWSGAKVKNVTGYLLHLLDNGTVVESIPCGSSESGDQRGFMDVELDPLGSCQVKLQAVGKGLKAPPGTAMDVIAYVPVVFNIFSESNKMSVTLDEPPNPPHAVNGYQIVLYKGDNYVLASEKTTGVLPNASIAHTFQPQFSYTVRAQAIGTDANILSGPLGPAKDIISTAPVIQSIDYDGTNATITWKPLKDEAVTGYAVVLTEAAEGAGDPWYTDDNTVVVPADKTKSYTVTVQATGDVCQGPMSNPKPILKETKKITGAFYDGQRLTVTWSGAKSDIVTGYLLHLLDNGTVVESIPCGSSESGEQRGFMDVELDPLGSYQVVLQAVGDGLTAPSGTPMDVIVAVPAILSVMTFADKVSVSVDKTLADGKQGVALYQAFLYEGNKQVAGPVTASGKKLKAEISYEVKEGRSYTVRIRATGNDAKVLTGPLSTPEPVVSSIPEILSADYDGTNIFVSWSVVTKPWVTGYLLEWGEQIGSTITKPSREYTTQTFLSIAVALEEGKEYAVSVRAIANRSAGNSSVLVNPLANATGYFLPERGISQYAYLFRGDIRNPGPADIDMYIPDIFNGSQDDITEAPFTLSTLTTPENGMKYKITVSHSTAPHVWKFTGSGVRSELQTAFNKFIKKVADVNGVLKPGGLALVRQVIAAALPLTFAETLYYHYGFDTGQGYIDLVEGMRLRMDFQNYQMVSPRQGEVLNGYVGTGTSVYDIAMQPKGDTELVTVFNSFLSRMMLPSVNKNSNGGGGVIDLQGSQFQHPFFRMFYPPNFPSSDSVGASDGDNNVVLIGADCYDNLETATTQFLAQHRFTDIESIHGIVYTFFKGRTVPIPEIKVFINNEPMFIPVGTTLRQVVSRFTALPMRAAVKLKGLAVYRSIGNLIDNPAQLKDGAIFNRVNKIHLGFRALNNYVYNDGLDCFELPLLAGDILEFNNE